jgi:membrane protein required for colicin V production
VNVLDYLLLAIVAFSVIPALIKGFVYESLMMAATVVGIWLAVFRYQQVAGLLQGVISNPEGRKFAAFLLILFGVLLAVALIAKLASGLIEAAGLRWFDHLLGMALGLVRGVLICTVLLIMMTAFPFNLGLMSQSSLAPDFLRAGNALVALLPARIGQQFRQGMVKLQHTETTMPLPSDLVPQQPPARSAP